MVDFIMMHSTLKWSMANCLLEIDIFEKLFDYVQIKWAEMTPFKLIKSIYNVFWVNVGNDEIDVHEIFSCGVQRIFML